MATVDWVSLLDRGVANEGFVSAVIGQYVEFPGFLGVAQMANEADAHARIREMQKILGVVSVRPTLATLDDALETNSLVFPRI